jgi:hypothetical protein
MFVMSHGGKSIAGIVSRRCHSPPLLQLRTISDTWMLNAPVRHDHFPEREPLGAKGQSICCSVVAMRKINKESPGAQCRDVVWASDAQAPGPGCGRSVGGPKAIISNTKTSRLSKTRQNVSCNVKISFLVVKSIIGCLSYISQDGSCLRNHQFFPSSCSPTSPATFSKSLSSFNFRIVALASKALQRSCNSPP